MIVNLIAKKTFYYTPYNPVIAQISMQIVKSQKNFIIIYNFLRLSYLVITWVLC